MPTGDHARGREWRRARRQTARRLHPDRGGDVAGYLEALAAVDRRFGVGGDARPADAGPVSVEIHRGWRPTLRRGPRRHRRTAGRAVRAVRVRLPRWVPGSVRYARL